MTRLNKVKKLLELHYINPEQYIPNNDCDAWNMYPKYNFIYNKMFICQYQNLKYAPVPIYPDEYPVIIKPIINLMGMGLESTLINNREEFKKYTTHFWMEYLEGKHMSWDLVIQNGKILYTCCFIGYKKQFGSFIYWKWLEIIDPPKIVQQFVNDNMKGYTGSLNIETINNIIIEAHLRMGDIDVLPIEILYYVVLNIIDKCDLEDIFNRIKQRKFKSIYLIPVWGKENTQEIYDYLEKYWEERVLDNSDIFFYYFDKPNHPTPTCNKRWFLFATENLKSVMEFSKMIEEDIT